MDQVVTKIKELQVTYNTASGDMRKSRDAYIAALETSYKNLEELYTSEHELLVAALNARQQLDVKIEMLQRELALAKLAVEDTEVVTEVTEPVQRPDNVTDE